MTATLHIETNRSARKYPRRVQAARVLWALGRLVFRLIPRPMYQARNAILRLFGAKVGRAVHISNTVMIYFPWELSIGDESAIGDGAYLYNLGRLVIGRRATISHRAHLCGGTHDDRDPALPLIKAPIEIGDDAWVCADAFVGPRVSIGSGAVVGARAVVMKDVAPWVVVAGNPARVIRIRELNERVTGD